MGTPGYAIGWFRLCDSADLPAGVVRSVTLGGQPRVLFRTAGGELALTQAHCPHMGAHLGHGGRVTGECLRCPFHGFEFARDGTCMRTGYPGDPRAPHRLQTFPVFECNGFVLGYHTPDGSAPDWQPEQLDTRDWMPPRSRTLRLRAHLRDLAENGVDLAHFRAVHRYTNISEPAIRFEGPRIHSRFSFDRENPIHTALGPVTALFDTDICGLGYSLTRLSVPRLGIRYRIFLTSNQVDAEHTDFTISVSAPRRPGFARTGLAARLPWERGVDLYMRYILGHVVNDVLQDREIWAHRDPTVRPMLVKGDGPITAFRNWAAQFEA